MHVEKQIDRYSRCVFDRLGSVLGSHQCFAEELLDTLWIREGYSSVVEQKDNGVQGSIQPDHLASNFNGRFQDRRGGARHAETQFGHVIIQLRALLRILWAVRTIMNGVYKLSRAAEEDIGDDEVMKHIERIFCGQHRFKQDVDVSVIRNIVDVFRCCLEAHRLEHTVGNRDIDLEMSFINRIWPACGPGLISVHEEE